MLSQRRWWAAHLLQAKGFWWLGQVLVKCSKTTGCHLVTWSVSPAFYLSYILLSRIIVANNY